MTPELDGPTGTAAWTTPAWVAAATAWMDERLGAAGQQRTGEVEQPRVRPWATLLTAPTTDGTVWLKATAPGTAAEVGLYEVLADVVPERVLRPLATDTARGWVLLPDGGPTLGDLLVTESGPDLAAAMAQVLQAYARLQRALEPSAELMIDIGLADMRPAVLAQRFDEALAAVEPWAAGHGAEERTTYEQLVGLRERVRRSADELAAMPGPASVDHNDLHQANVLVTTLDDLERCRFYDWGDAVLAHPFASQLVPLSMIAAQVGADDPRFLHARDAYLAVYDDLAPRDELVRALELACWLAKIARCLTWARAMAAAGDAAEPGGDFAHFAGAPYETLASMLLDGYLGGA